LANPAVLSVSPYLPGKSISAIRKEYHLQEVIKLASNENPAGPSPLALEAVAAAVSDIHLYPEEGADELKEALARKHGVRIHEIILGHGATDILDIITRTFICPGDEILSAHPSFPWFQMLGQLSGAQNVLVPLREHKHDLTAMRKRITPHTKLIFIANPNNPTGTYLTKAEIESFLSSVPEDVVVVLDEAYIDYVTSEKIDSRVSLSEKRVITVRTFSKVSGLAGLRIGYAVAQPEIIEFMEKARQPFNTTMLAHVAALAALQDREHLEKSRQMVADGKKFLYHQFQKLFLDFIPTEANFIFVDFHKDVKGIVHQLQQRGFIIRPVSATCARITIGSPPQNLGLVRSLQSVLSSLRTNPNPEGTAHGE
jgi:histidinol-phosphate aminotransferase